MDLAFETSVRVTDIAIVIATLAGPFLAVYVTEQQRKWADARNRKVHVFRALMATRSATLAAIHIESLNLVEIEFHSEREVLDHVRLYLSHLHDHDYPQELWEARRKDLMIELLYSMSKALKYSFEKSQIKSSAYYPKGYGDADSENVETRKLWLEVLKGSRQIPMRAEVYAPQQLLPQQIETNNNA